MSKTCINVLQFTLVSRAHIASNVIKKKKRDANASGSKTQNIIFPMLLYLKKWQKGNKKKSKLSHSPAYYSSFSLSLERKKIRESYTVIVPLIVHLWTWYYNCTLGEKERYKFFIHSFKKKKKNIFLSSYQLAQVVENKSIRKCIIIPWPQRKKKDRVHNLIMNHVTYHC